MWNFFFFLSLFSSTLGFDSHSKSTRSLINRDLSLTESARLVQYVQTFHVNGNTSEPLSLLPLKNKSSGVTHVIFAMTHLGSAPGDIHLNDNPYNASIFDQAWSDAKQLQAAGIKLIACMGGAGDDSYAKLAQNFEGYYQPLLALMRNYSIDGFDLDIEEPSDIKTVLRLIQSFYKDMGPNFIITMAPVASALISANDENLSGFSYFTLDAEAVSNGQPLISFYNAQFYSGFGSPISTQTYDSIISAGWAPARVSMGVLDSPSDGSGYVATSTVISTIKSLRAKYPTFCGINSWEYFNAGSADGDKVPYEWDEAIGAALGTTTSVGVTKRAKKSRAYHPRSNDAIADLTA